MFMKKNILFLLSFFSAFNLSGQLNIGGQPHSFNKNNQLKLQNDISKIYILPKLNNEKLKAEAEKNDKKDKPWQFGKNINVDIDLKKHALVDSLSDGKLYRLMIISEDALTINLKFSKFKIPDKATLYIYNADKSDILGGFTSSNMQKSGTFAVSLIKGDKIILEYFEPNEAEISGELAIGRVTHGFRGVGEYGKGFGNSGDCNMNVACDTINWGNEIKSVCMLVSGGSGFCSASLINNTQEDGTPYILTANHCYEDPSDLVFMFNWQSVTCENPAVSPSHDDLSGAVLRARDYESDFCLFEMNDIPPYTYKVYYAGWNNEDAPSTSSVCIHHPSADIKKISYDDNASVTDYYLGSSSDNQSHWKVIWDRNTTTEGGSSGSPLFDQNHKIIGQLHGGYASCSNLDEPDWFGKFSYSWATGETPETRLKDWLDPLNLNVTEFDGYDPNLPLEDNDAQVLKINAPENYYFGENSFTPSVKIRNRGNQNLTSVNVSYQIDNKEINTKIWNGNLSTGEIIDISFDEITLSFAKHDIKVWTDKPNGLPDGYVFNDTLQTDFYVYDVVFFDDFENANIWELSGEFQIGSPENLGGEKGFPDPETAFSGNSVLGTDLSGLGQHPGDYENEISWDKEYAISPMIDCRNYENCLLNFKRQLGIDKYKFDKADIEILSDTGDWQTVWKNTNTVISDIDWTNQTIDISGFADGRKILIRFSVGPTDHADQYCGWNIDDFMIAGNEISDPDIREADVFVYPNPSTGYFYIDFLNLKSITFADVLVSDLSGKIVFQKHFSENEIKLINNSSFRKNLIKINLKENNSGIFIVNIKTNDMNYTSKIILFSEKK